MMKTKGFCDWDEYCRSKGLPFCMAMNFIVNKKLDKLQKMLNNATFKDSYKNNCNDLFLYACIFSNFDIIKLLWDTFKDDINIHLTDKDMFYEVCENGNLEIVKFLIEISGNKLDVKAENYKAFIVACRYNAVEVANYLYDLCDIGSSNVNLAKLLSECTHTKICNFLKDKNTVEI